MATIEMSKMKVGSNVVEIVDQKARDGITQLNTDKDELQYVKADVIKCTRAGDIIVATDSSDAKFEGLRVFGRSTQATTTGKNLFGGELLADEIVSKFKGDKNSASKTVTYSCTNVDEVVLFEDFKENQQYTIILDGNCTDKTYANIMIVYTDGTNSGSLSFSDNGTACFVTTPNKSVRCISGYWSSGRTTLNYEKCGIFEGVITLEEFEKYTGGKPSPNPEYPQPIKSVGDDGNIDVEVYGGNLVNSKKIVKNRNESVNVSDDGYTITVRGGTSLNWSDSYIDIVEFPKLKGKKLYVSIDSVSATNVKATNVSFIVVSTTGKTNYSLQDGKKEVVIPYDAKDVYFSISTNYSEYPLSSQNEVVVKGLMVSLSDIPYEPYKKTQTLVSTVGDGLCGIPLGATIPDAIASSEKHMRGVWWCEEEQQYYISDTKEYGRGKNVQRIAVEVVDGTHQFVGSTVLQNVTRSGITVKNKSISPLNSLCSHLICVRDYNWDSEHYYIDNNGTMLLFISNETIQSAGGYGALIQNLAKSDNPIIVQYILAEPIETDLSAEEIEAFKALHSNYPTTTILNDENAHMEATLVADTKNHIEQNYVPLNSYKLLEARVLAVEKALA